MSKAKVLMVMYVMCLAFTSGCAAWTDKSKSKDSMWSSMKFWKKPYQKPTKLAAIWTHDILTMSGKPPTRGFGGRFYFYNDKSQTIPVEGELVVHGYEEVRIGLYANAEKTKPDKTFMFTAEQFTEHFGSSDLGASYSIWIPWDAADGIQKEITLIPTFKGKDGTILQGEPAKLVLPGRKLEDPFANAAIQHFSIQQSQTPTNMGPLPQLSGLRTTTISIPGQINRAKERNANQSAAASSVVVHESNRNGQPNAGQPYNAQPSNAMNGNMTYANPLAAARANALLANYAAQGNANQTTMHQTGLNPTPSMPNAYQMSNGVPFPSTMPNAVPVQTPQNQFQSHSYNLQTPTAPSQQQPNSMGPTMNNQQLPNGLPPRQQPGIQPLTPNNNLHPVNHLSPGFADYAPLKDGAVEAAFASTPQFQPLGQSVGQVQPAGFNMTPGLNSTPAVVTSGQVTSGLGWGQLLPAQSGQSIFQR
jgi:hypothetical protein